MRSTSGASPRRPHGTTARTAMALAALVTSAFALLLVALDREGSGAVLPAHTPAAQTADVAPAAGRGRERGDRYLETRLFFGTGRHHGNPPITEEEFHAFLDREITPRFPSGLTLQEGYGQWRDREGDINGERSYELILLYPADTARRSDAAIEEIRRAYTSRWDLESVGRVDHYVRVDF
ncbi:DUF3574 domain-containing protein [Streptomyces chumphonensis]|nr:DUF3574 domain-containing protein [Streptomyces chumphonensis]